MSSQQTSARACKADKNNKLVFHPCISIIFSSFCASSVFSSLTCLTSDWVPMTRRFWWDTHGARWPANQLTNQLPRRSHFPLIPPFILPTAAPNWPIASQCFSGICLPASCYQLWPLAPCHPWVAPPTTEKSNCCLSMFLCAGFHQLLHWCHFLVSTD